MKLKILVQGFPEEKITEYTIYERTYWWIIPVGWKEVLCTQNSHDLKMYIESLSKFI